MWESKKKLGGGSKAALKKEKKLLLQFDLLFFGFSVLLLVNKENQYSICFSAYTTSYVSIFFQVL